MPEGHRTFEHTGDVGLEVWAESPERLFALAAEALMGLIAEAGDAAPEVVVPVRLAGDDPADLLVHWLNTVLLEAELARAVWTRVEVTALTPVALEATLAGPRLDRGRQAFLREVKAVSQHALHLDLEGVPCRCRLVLDV